MFGVEVSWVGEEVEYSVDGKQETAAMVEYIQES
jgi:hypothetical protein